MLHSTRLILVMLHWTNVWTFNIQHASGSYSVYFIVHVFENSTINAPHTPYVTLYMCLKIQHSTRLILDVLHCTCVCKFNMQRASYSSRCIIYMWNIFNNHNLIFNAPHTRYIALHMCLKIQHSTRLIYCIIHLWLIRIIINIINADKGVFLFLINSP